MSEGAVLGGEPGRSVSGGPADPAEAGDVPGFDPERSVTVSCDRFEKMCKSFVDSGGGNERLLEGLSDAQFKVMERLRKFCNEPGTRCSVNGHRDECLVKRANGTDWTFESFEHAKSVLLRIQIRQAGRRRRPRSTDGVNPPSTWEPLPDQESDSSDDERGRRLGPPVAVEEADAERQRLDRFTAITGFERQLERALKALEGLPATDSSAQQHAREVARRILVRLSDDPSNDWMARRSDEVKAMIAAVDPRASGRSAAARKRQSRLREGARTVLVDIGLTAEVVEVMLPVEGNMARGNRTA